MNANLPFINTPLEELRARVISDPTARWINYRLECFGDGWVEASMLVEPKLLSPIGRMHASSVIAFADLTCGVGTYRLLPSENASFATIELKTNHLGTAQGGKLLCRAESRHIGKGTQVWDAVVTVAESGKTITLFRCTQMILSTPAT